MHFFAFLKYKLILEELEVAHQACACMLVISVLSDSLWPYALSPPGSSVRGILQARILECIAMPSSRGSAGPRDQTRVSCGSCIAGSFFTAEPLGTHWAKMGYNQMMMLEEGHGYQTIGAEVSLILHKKKTKKAMSFMIKLNNKIFQINYYFTGIF